MLKVSHLHKEQHGQKSKQIFILEKTSGRTFITEYKSNETGIGAGRVLKLEEFTDSVNTALEDQYSKINKNNKINKKNDLGLLDERIILMKHNKLVWKYTPKPSQFLYLKYGSSGYVGKFNWPTLVFKLENRTLSVAVLRSSKNRPTSDTRIYHAPLPNIYVNGNICLGTALLPKGNDIDEISEAYLNSTKTNFLKGMTCFRNKEIKSMSHYLKWVKEKAHDKIKVSELAPMGTITSFIN